MNTPGASPWNPSSISKALLWKLVRAVFSVVERIDALSLDRNSFMYLLDGRVSFLFLLGKSTETWSFELARRVRLTFEFVSLNSSAPLWSCRENPGFLAQWYNTLLKLLSPEEPMPSRSGVALKERQLRWSAIADNIKTEMNAFSSQDIASLLFTSHMHPNSHGQTASLINKLICHLYGSITWCWEHAPSAGLSEMWRCASAEM